MPASEEADADEEEAGMAVLLDKLSERLAFERMGTRLYEALLNKCEMLGEAQPGPDTRRHSTHRTGRVGTLSSAQQDNHRDRWRPDGAESLCRRGRRGVDGDHAGPDGSEKFDGSMLAGDADG